MSLLILDDGWENCNTDCHFSYGFVEVGGSREGAGRDTGRETGNMTTHGFPAVRARLSALWTAYQSEA